VWPEKATKTLEQMKGEEPMELKLKTYASIENEPVHTLPVVQIISRKMLATSRSLKTLFELPTLKGVPLNTPHICRCIFPCNQWILSRRLLSSPPSWVPKYINVRSPKRHPLGLPGIVHRSSFGSNHLKTRTIQLKKKKKMSNLD
jgi:hypothetical protein